MLFNRHKMLLALLESLGGDVGATDFQEHLFLFTRLFETDKSFEFLPYRFGCYSFQAVADKRKLVYQGLLVDDENWRIAKPKLSYLQALLPRDRTRVKAYVDRHGNLTGKRLIRHVYKNYPYFAINSEIAESHLSDAEYARVVAARPKRRRKPMFFTIGYEGQSVESYLNRLIENDIRLLVDVRKIPLSRKFGFSKSAMLSLCKNFGIQYVHLPELGIAGEFRRNLVDQQDYERVFEHYGKEVISPSPEWIQYLIGFFSEYNRIAITCFERDHSQCHRDRVLKAVCSIAESEIAFAHL